MLRTFFGWNCSIKSLGTQPGETLSQTLRESRRHGETFWFFFSIWVCLKIVYPICQAFWPFGIFDDFSEPRWMKRSQMERQNQTNVQCPEEKYPEGNPPWCALASAPSPFGSQLRTLGSPNTSSYGTSASLKGSLKARLFRARWGKNIRRN